MWSLDEHFLRLVHYYLAGNMLHLLLPTPYISAEYYNGQYSNLKLITATRCTIAHIVVFSQLGLCPYLSGYGGGSMIPPPRPPSLTLIERRGI